MPSFMLMCVCVCVCALFLQLGVSLKWSYLSQHSSPMTGGMEGNRDGGPERDQR